MRLCDKPCFVLDLDGTVYLGDIPIQGTVDFLRAQEGKRDLYFLSNNTSKSSSTYVRKLQSLGLAVRPEQILSPLTPLVDWLREQKISRAYPVGNREFTSSLAVLMPELTQTEVDAQVVILAYDTELTYAKLATSALLLQRPEVRFVATHPDLVCPSPAGPLPDVGSFLALYATATGRSPEHIFGKPSPAVLAPLLARYAREDMVMVGDRLSTDKALADNAGIDFILVLSGEATRADLARLATQPRAVLEHLGQLADLT